MLVMASLKYLCLIQHFCSDKVQALGCDGRWASAVITAVLEDKYTVHFDGWSNRWNYTLTNQYIRVPVEEQEGRSRLRNKLVNVNDPFNRVILSTSGQMVLMRTVRMMNTVRIKALRAARTLIAT